MPQIRNTKQRIAVMQVFERLNRPLSPEEVLKGAKKGAPGIGIATVYRSIRDLLKDGWLIPVQLPGEPARYEVAGKTHHHHFHCRDCNNVFEIEGCPGNFSRYVPSGFRLEDHHLILYGICKACRGDTR